jgi:hypothetical protein
MPVVDERFSSAAILLAVVTVMDSFNAGGAAMERPVVTLG